ncbi:hypothetical protein DmGdi_02180 [Gluconobacter sp. Gdi]|nr:hypothetical protein DmGdi_02180 [Gluconobacter sp. Gdi]
MTATTDIPAGVATAAATTTLAGAAVAGAAGDRAMLSDRPEAAAGEVDTAVAADLGVAHPQADPEEAVVQAEASLVVAVPAAVASMAEVRAAEEVLEGADMVVAVTVAPVVVDATDTLLRGRREPVPELLHLQRVDQNASAPQCST